MITGGINSTVINSTDQMMREYQIVVHTEVQLYTAAWYVRLIRLLDNVSASYLYGVSLSLWCGQPSLWCGPPVSGSVSAHSQTNKASQEDNVN